MSENNSRLFRGPINKSRSNVEPCNKGSADCMFLSTGGGCSAESCIFDELPLVTGGSRQLTCSVCGTNKTTVSIYSGTTSFICPECQEKLKKITQDEKLCSVCKVNKVSVDQYICLECQTKLVKSIENSTCTICGANTGIGDSICSSCAEKIKVKINE